MPTPVTIGELSNLTGIKVETIRYYERIGLLSAPPRTAANYRTYDQFQVGRLGFIRRARELGFSIDEIRKLLALADQQGQSCESVDEVARQHLADVDRKIADLKGLRRELNAIIRQCDQGTIEKCRILEALAPRNGSPALEGDARSPKRGNRSIFKAKGR